MEEKKNSKEMLRLEISSQSLSHLFAVRSLAGSDGLQVELGVSLLHLLHTAVN